MENEAKNEVESDHTVKICLSQCLDVVETVDHVPYSFQCPAQLLTLRCALFQKNIFAYCQSLSSMEEYFRRTFSVGFQDQVLVTGFTFNGLAESSSWKKDLILTLGDTSLPTFSVNGSIPGNYFHESNEKLILLDKLDLAEFLNCQKTISSCKEVVECNAITRHFELAFPCPFFLTGVDNLLSLLLNAISSLLQVLNESICVSYRDIHETLLEFPFWVHRNYAEAFLKVQDKNLMYNNQINGVRVVRLERKISPTVFLCFKDGSRMSPSVLLHWYREYLVKRIIETLSSTSNYDCDELSTLLAKILT